MIITLLVFLAILAVLVIVHELGHFLAAKWNGVVVEEFAFGFRPKLWGKKIGETFYAINAIPLGGYVRMRGENDGVTGPGALNNKKIWQRVTIMLAGPLANLIFGWIILMVLFWTGFQPLFPGVAKNRFVTQTATVAALAIAPNSPASEAKLIPGDTFISVAGEKVATAEEFISVISNHLGEPTTLIIQEGKKVRTVQLTPRAHPPAGQGAIGITLGSAGSVKASGWHAPLAAAIETGRLIGLSIAGFGHFLATLVVHQQVSSDVTGLVGVGVLTGVARRLGFAYLMQLVLMISIGLGIVNLLPILPLDGGQIIALGYEKAAGRPLSEAQLGRLVTLGLVIVAALFVIVTYKDLTRLNFFHRL